MKTAVWPRAGTPLLLSLHTFPDPNLYLSAPPCTAAHRLPYTSHECLLSLPVRPPSLSLEYKWGQQARYRHDSNGLHRGGTQHRARVPSTAFPCRKTSPKESWELTRWGEGVLHRSRRLQSIFRKRRLKRSLGCAVGRNCRGRRPR